MDRLTIFDNVRGCYIIKPDVHQGANIQRLGKLEDRDEAQKPLESDFSMLCPICYTPVMMCDFESRSRFCSGCGQRIDWAEKEEEANVKNDDRK